MRLQKWQPRREMRRVADEMDRWFDDFLGGRGFLHAPWRGGGVRPWVDVYETEDEVVVKLEVPGIRKEDLEITLSEREVTLKGETKMDEEGSAAGYHRRERRHGSFVRTISLPSKVVADQAKATCKNGVIELRAPKHPDEAAKKRKIEVQ